MNPQSTDKVSADANQLVPRIVSRGSLVVTTNTASGTNYYGTTTVTLSDIKASSNCMVDLFVLNNNALTKCNFVTMPNNKQQSLCTENVHYYLSSSGGLMTLTVYRYSTSNSESRTFYYVVYSTKITGDSVL